MLRQHGRYAWSPIVQRPVYDWPGGRRLAVSIAVNVEVFPFGEGLAPDLQFNLSLHPYLVGHAFRLEPLRRFLAHLAAHREQVWITHPGEIARHVRGLLD